MRTLRERNPRRLGPLVVYEGNQIASHWLFHGFLADPFEPATELVVVAARNTRPTDPWFRRGPDHDGVAQNWRFRARPRDPTIHLLDLVVLDLTADEREALALAVLNASRLDYWKPPDWFPSLGDAYVTYDGNVAFGLRWRHPSSRVMAPSWDSPLIRHINAALLAACLVGENAFRACLSAARKLAAGEGEHITQHSFRSALIVELISVLLIPNTSRGPHLIPGLRALAPSRDDIGRIVSRAAADQLAELRAWNEARARLQPADIADVPPFHDAASIDVKKTFRRQGKYVVYQTMNTWSGASHGFPVDGAFRDLAVVSALAPLESPIDLSVLVDPWGRPFEIDASSETPAAARDAAPLSLNSATNRVHVALQVLRAVARQPPIIAPSIACITTTLDGRICVDGFEPSTQNTRWRTSSADWRKQWALVLLDLVGRDKTHATRAGFEEVRAEPFSDDSTADDKLRRGIRALVSTMSWSDLQAEVAFVCDGLEETVTPIDDPETNARVSFVQRERDRIVSELQEVRAEDAHASQHRTPKPSAAHAVFEDVISWVKRGFLR